MAQRLATEYKYVSLTLNRAQLTEFIRLFRFQKARLEEKVFENGDHEITLFDQSEEVKLTFEKVEESYLLTGHCTFKDRNLAELMRKAMTTFKGKAIMNRVFPSFKVEYRYDRGTVMSIREINDSEARVIFENKDFTIQLEQILSNRQVEKEIHFLRNQVDYLLDLRNKANQVETKETIDGKLLYYAKRLVELEA